MNKAERNMAGYLISAPRYSDMTGIWDNWIYPSKIPRCPSMCHAEFCLGQLSHYLRLSSFVLTLIAIHPPFDFLQIQLQYGRAIC